MFANVHGKYDAGAHHHAKRYGGTHKACVVAGAFLSLSDKTYKTRAIGDTPARAVQNYILIGSMSKCYYRHASGWRRADESGIHITLDDHAARLMLVAGCRRYTRTGSAHIGSFTGAKVFVWADNNFKSTRLIRNRARAQIPAFVVKAFLRRFNAESLAANRGGSTSRIRKEFDLPDKLLAPVKGQSSVTLVRRKQRQGAACAASDVGEYAKLLCLP